MSAIKSWQSRVEFDGQQVTITKTFRGSTTIPISQIGAIEILRSGIGFHSMRFSAGGGTIEGRRGPLGSYSQALNDPYSVVFRSGRRAEFEQLRDEINQARQAK